MSDISCNTYSGWEEGRERKGREEGKRKEGKKEGKGKKGKERGGWERGREEGGKEGQEGGREKGRGKKKLLLIMRSIPMSCTDKVFAEKKVVLYGRKNSAWYSETCLLFLILLDLHCT